jgi:hypothetical protein
LCGEFLLLENEGNKAMTYSTEYLDTADCNMFYEHQRDRAHRYKIRRRKYGNDSDVWFEVKEKLADGRTIKHRLLNPTQDEKNQLIHDYSPYNTNELKPMLMVAYDRLTFLHKQLPLKVTVDMKLKATDNISNVAFSELLIVECKSENRELTSLTRGLKLLGLKPCSLSKYCISMATLHPELKQNAFKPTLLHINKVTANGYSKPV